MRTWAFVIGIASVAVFLSCAQPRALDESDFVVVQANGRVKLALSEPISEVLVELGQPLSTKVRKKSGQEPPYMQHTFKGLVVGYYENDKKVTLLRITGPEFTTSRGVSVGATLEQVRKAYGPTKDEWPTVVQYQLKDDKSKLGLSYRASFWMDGNVVNGIDINRAP